MRYIFLLLLLVLSAPAIAAASDDKSEISKLSFDGVYFGDFPSVDMICVRGLCPVGDLGVGTNNRPLLFTGYTQERSLSHYAGVRISTPVFNYFDDKMALVTFFLQCSTKAQQECLNTVRLGLDAEYGLALLERSAPEGQGLSETQSLFKGSEAYVTESKSLVSLFWGENSHPKSFATVSISDKYLLDSARLAVNPNFVPLTLPDRSELAEVQ